MLDQEADRVGGVPGRVQHLDLQAGRRSVAAVERLGADAVLRIGGQHGHAAEQLGQPGGALDVVVVTVRDQNERDRPVLGDPRADGPRRAGRGR